MTPNANYTNRTYLRDIWVTILKFSPYENAFENVACEMVNMFGGVNVFIPLVTRLFSYNE